MQTTIDKFKSITQTLDPEIDPGIAETFAEVLEFQLFPEERWECLAYGSYKETYDVGSRKFILKFASSDVNLRIEEALYRKVSESNLSNFFCATHYIPLPCKIPSTYIEDNSYFNTIIIQERVDLLALDDPDIKFFKLNDTFHIDEKNELSPYTEFGVDSKTWFSDVLKFYGPKEMINLIKFLRKYDVYDLGSANTGYINKRPVILDWLS